MTAGLGLLVSTIVNSRAPLAPKPDDLFTATTMLGLGVITVLLPWRYAATAVAGLVATWLAGYWLYDRVPELLHPPVPVGDAVGGAAFFRSPYLGQQLAGAALIVLTAALGALLARRRRRASATEAAPTPDQRSIRSARRSTILAIGLIALTLIPDLHQLLVVQSRGAFKPGWDMANLVTWDYFLQQGLKPMADFWFPYGNSWILLDFATGPAVMFFWQVLLLSIAGWALWRLIGPRPWRIAWCLFGVVVLGLFDLPGITTPPTFWRYLPALVLAVTYAAVGPLRHRAPTRAHGVLLLICAATAAMEADLLAVGLGGMLFIALGDIGFAPGLRRGRQLIRAVAVDLLPVIGGVVFMLGTWAVAGSFHDNVRWFGDFRTVSAFAGASQDRLGALRGLDVAPSFVLLLATIPALLLVVAFVLRRLDGRTERAASVLLLAAAGASAVILAKHLVRPQGVIVLFLPLVALLWCVALCWSARSVRSWLAVGVFVGVLGSLMHAAAAVPFITYLRNAAKVPVTIVENIAQIADRGELDEAANRRFAPERFAGMPEKTVVADPLAGALNGMGDSRFAVLGDAQILYVLFHQTPPDHIELYSTSPKDEQRDFIAALRRIAPARLVWERVFNVDGVPYPVRNPLIFAYAIQHFVPERNGNPWDLLRRRRADEPVPLEYWRGRLGDTSDLGAIPSYSDGAEADACTQGSDCAPYAVVTGKPSRDGSKAIIDVKGGRYRFKIAMTTYKGIERYSVRLDRLWFWPFVARSARVSPATPGWRVRRINVNAGGALY